MSLNWVISKTPKEWREKHKLTQSEMAKLLNMSRVAYNTLERGKSTPSLETMIKMQWLGEKIKEIENKGEYKGYTVLRIGGMYEIDIEEE